MGTNVKFFKDNVLDENATYSFTSANTSLSKYLYDNNLDTKLTSSGSDDLTPEVFLITFSSAKTIDRIFVGNHNIKSGKIEYWDGAAYVDFTNDAISWSANTANHNYFTFDSVSTERIRLTMDTTQTADAEKYVGQLRAMEEIGEVQTNPSKVKFTYRKHQKKHIVSTGGNVQVVFGEKYQAMFYFSDANTTDITLFKTLNDNNAAFYVYPGGGDTSITEYGFRIQDMYLVNYVNDFAPNLKNNLFNIGQRITLVLHEV